MFMCNKFHFPCFECINRTVFLQTTQYFLIIASLSQCWTTIMFVIIIQEMKPILNQLLNPMSATVAGIYQAPIEHE